MKQFMYWLVLLCCVLLTATGCQHDPVVYAERIEIVKELPVYCSQLDSSKLVSADEINFTLRHRKDGDKIQPLGSKGSQKLKKYLNEKKIPQHEKDKLIFLCKDNEILWAAGIGISEKIKVAQKPTHMLKLEKR